MRNILASIGIGNASVDTVLPTDTVRPGAEIQADVEIAGGDAEQEVRGIELELETRYRTDEGREEGTVGRLHLADAFTVSPGQSRTERTTLEIPWGTPVTVGGVEVWVETVLDVAGVDPDDRDYLEVRPSARLGAVFDAMEALGFTLHTSECSRDPYDRYGGGVVQEFEFRPEGGPFAGTLDEVDLLPRESAEGLTLHVEVDRDGGLFGELAETDESHATLTVTSEDPEAVREELRRTIERYA